MFAEMDLRLAAILVAALYFSTAAGMSIITQKQKSVLLRYKNDCKKNLMPQVLHMPTPMLN